MDRAFSSGASGSAPTAPASPSVGYPTAGNPSTGTPATKPGPYWYHMIVEELLAVIGVAGLTPAQGNLTQLLTALRSAGVFQTPGQFDNTTKAATTAFVKAAGLQYSGQSNIAAAATLNSTHFGKLINLSGVAGVVTLPLTSSVPTGSVLSFWCQTSGWSIARAGADVINFGSTSSISSVPLSAGDTLILESDGTGSWVALGGSAQLGYSVTRHTVAVGSRLANTSYTNTTGKVMFVNALFSQTSAFHAYTIGSGPSVGDQIDGPSAAYGRRLIFLVLPGETYGWAYNGGLAIPTLAAWTETY